jgi:hypothetical protein
VCFNYIYIYRDRDIWQYYDKLLISYFLREELQLLQYSYKQNYNENRARYEVTMWHVSGVADSNCLQHTISSTISSSK